MKNFDPASAGATPVRNFPAKSACRNLNCTLFSVDKRKNLFLLGKVLLLLMLFSLKTGLVKGQKDDHLDTENKLVKSAYDQYGAYIDFTLTYYDDDNSDSYVTDGNLYASVAGGNEFKIIHLNSYKQDETRDYKVNVYIYEGPAWVRSWENDHPVGPAVNNSGWTFIKPDKHREIGGDIGTTARLYIRWYVPDEYSGKNLTFRYECKANIDDDLMDNPDSRGFVQSSRTVTPLSTLNVQEPIFSDSAGYFAVSYGFSDKNQYATSIAFNGQEQTGNKYEAPSGTFIVPMSNTTINKEFSAKADLKPVPGYSGYYAASYTESKKIVIPAYIWPDTIQAVYDGKDTIKLNWNIIKPLNDNNIDGDNFEIQRSTDPEFEKNVKTVGSVAYDKTITDYSLDDNLSDIKGGSHVYYRLRRTKSNSQWGWEETRKTDVAITLNTARDTTRDTAVLDESKGAKAYIHFDPFQGVWLNGTKFSLKRTNVTTNETSVIDLTEEQARSGQYIDESITYCKQFIYSIELTLGNGYASPPETEVPGSILAVQIGTISDLATSKGYFPDRVELRWKSDGGFDNYIVKRKEYGSSDNYIQVVSVPTTASPEVVADDPKAAPGIYYEYLIMGTVSCNHTVRYSDTLHAIGFRSPTGNIYGRITYENGQAVENAVVRLENEDNTGGGQSIYLNGNAKSYLKLDSLHTPFTDSAFTIEAWIKPDEAMPKNEIIFSRGNKYELGFDDNGRLYFNYNGQSVTGNYENKNQIFIHVAAIHGRDSLFIMLNDSVIAKAAAPSGASHTTNGVVYIGRSAAGHNFKGYIDEMSAWNIALSSAQVAKNYTRILTGDEQGLVAYWRFDETIANQFYDLSHEGERYHQNDGGMNPDQVKRSSVRPTAGQLALKGYTDSTGNYAITGIPYVGSNGTTYDIVPLMGTHKFDPVDVKRLISASTPAYTVDFTDISSFPVSGYIYYRHSRVPVPDVQFLIDGKYAQESNGSLIQTGDDGKFTISVPVGTHEVRAVKNNHVFVNGGRITDSRGNDLNYQKPVSERILYDSTTVRFIGRVAGGAVQESYPLGHSLSTNNLGKELKITLTLSTGSSQWLVTMEDGSMAGDSTVIVDHLLPSGRAGDSSHIHKTRVEWQSKPGINQIIIYPDSLTGEFEADLIPVKFITTDVKATGWGNLLENGNAVALDLTNRFFKDSSVYSYDDSTQANDGSWNYDHYSDTVLYNFAYQFIKRVKPGVSITQINDQGKDESYFGDSLYNMKTLLGEETNITLIDDDKSGADRYLFNGHPVFSQSVLYHFKIRSFEEYPFYESVKQDGTPIHAQQDGKDIVDQVPTADGSLSLYNNLQAGNEALDTLSLDSTGMAYYDFVAGEPATAPGDNGLKSFAATIRFRQATDVNWQWFGDDAMQAFVLGSKQTGTDFVTAGPNRMLMVLRDPPGSRSYSFAEQGNVISNQSTYSGTVDNTYDITATGHFGLKEITWEGVGGGVIQEEEITSDLGIGVHLESHYTHTDTKVTTTTLTNRFQTSNDPTFVGAPADLFVGYSTNITYGQSENLTLIKSKDRQAGDSVIFNLPESEPGSDYMVVERAGISLGENFGTLFAYPQQHIETVLIPNLEKIRNTILLPPSISPTAAQQAANDGKKEVYVSKLSVDNENFGKSNNDESAFGNAAKEMPFDNGPSYKIYFPENSDYHTDTIMTINQYIRQWEQTMADNEKAKLESTLLQNYSFHAGNPVDYSEQTSSGYTTSNSFNIIVSGSIFTEDDAKMLGIGIGIKTNAVIGTNQGGDFESTHENSSTLGFELAADGLGEYISVDVNKTDDGGLAFRTKGGETECPYEGIDTTKYYNPGTVIGLPTAQMDKPEITVDNPVVSNVPATQKAAYTIHLINASEAAWSTNFVLTYGSTDSVKGAYIAADALSIAGGINYPVIYGEPITKVLTLTKGPDAMDYNNIPIILHSACQYDPTGYQQTIADTVLVSAHFVPSCSNVNVKAPADNWVLNALSVVNQQGNRYLPITLDQFDESNSLFDHIELQYKPAANSQWITAMNFYGDSTKYNNAEGDKAFITNAQEIHYNIEMDDASFNDQQYDVRALAVCQLGPGNFINTPSEVISGMKDTYNPRLFGSPEPANGILGATDEIRLNFNETIAGGLLTHNDFQVTGIRNGAKGDHSVSVSLDGQNDYMETEFEKNLTGRDITAEMWILPDRQENATLFSQGNINESMELAITQDNHLQVTIGKKKVVSDKQVDYDPGQWAHVALVYNAKDSMVSAFYNFKEVIHGVTTGSYNGIGRFDFGKSISENGHYFAGKMHGVRIWTKELSATTLQTNSLIRLSGAENGLLACYPMTEGKGSIVYDKAHANNAFLIGTWKTPPGKAMAFNGNGYIQMPTGTVPVTPDMDYTIELWFKAQPRQSNAALVSNGKGDGTDPGPTDSKNLFFLGFEDGLLTFENNGTKIQVEGNYLDNQWHQLALSINRLSEIAQLYVDGVLKKYFDAQNIGGIASPFIYLGARSAYSDADLVNPHFDRYFRGSIDEFRLWNTYLNKELIADKSNVRLKGDELGLMAYYPFERYIEHQNNKELDSTTLDMKIAEKNPVTLYAKTVHATITDDMAPIKDRGPVDNLQFDYVVNNDALIINLLEPGQSVDKTIVTFRMRNATDMHGNPLLSPITWTAYIDQNPLKWGDDEFNLVKGADTAMRFTSYIINKGGNIQHFTLDNLPPWLTASVTNGTVDPEGRQPITFTVKEGLNVGAYDEIIYMRNDNGETESLAVNLKVNGHTPDWKVTPADFQYNMTVYGKLRIDQIFSDDPEDMLAAFMDGKCVGVAHNSYITANDLWYVFLTVYSDSITYDNLEFRIWDASTGKIYEGMPSEPIHFKNDAVAGAPYTPVIFDGKEMLIQNMYLNEGWNWISFNLENANLDNVKTTLSKGSWQPGDIVKHDLRGFDQYSVSNGWVGTLPGFDNLSLFKLKTGNAQTLSTNGTAVDVKKTPIPLKGQQWNYISYLPQTNMTLKDALAGYEAYDGDQIKSQTGFAMYDHRIGWVGSLTYLKPGKGYMLYRKVETDTSFVYPNIPGILRLSGGADNDGNIARLNDLEVPVANNYTYADNMTVVAEPAKGFTLLPGDKILAYTGTDLRGKAQAIQNPTTGENAFFFNVSGKNNEPVHFEVERNGKTVAQTSAVMSYMPNSMMGTLKQPFMLHFGKPSIEAGISPNPFHDKVSVHATLSPGSHEVQMTVYDVSGHLVKSYVKQTTNGKYYNVTWNGTNGSGATCTDGIYFIHLLVDDKSYVYKVVKN